MEWTSIIIALIGSILGGGIVSIFTIRESKKNMQLDNEGKEIENKDKEQEIHLKLIDELQEQVDKLNERCDKKDALLEEKNDAISDLREKLDKSRSRCSVAEIIKCVKTECPDRIPKIGTRYMDVDAIIAESEK